MPSVARRCDLDQVPAGVVEHRRRHRPHPGRLLGEDHPAVLEAFTAHAPTGRPRPKALQDLRPLLFSIAYGMVSSVTDADYIVQEALLRYKRALNEGVEIESPKAFLSAAVTRLAVDSLRSARARRETYVGEWLPEPLVTDGDDPAAQAETGRLALDGLPSVAGAAQPGRACGLPAPRRLRVRE
jgi:Sigma-70 region 2